MIKDIADMIRELPKIKIQIVDLEIQIEDIEEDVELRSVSAISYSERTGQTYKISSQTENKALELIEKVNILKGRKKALERMVARIENAMELLDDLQKELIELKYIKNMKYWQIEEKFKKENRIMSDRNIIRKIENALKKMNEVLKR